MVISVVNPNGHVFSISVQICTYADGIAIIVRDTASLKNAYKVMEQETKNVVLITNECKTKYMVLTSGSLKRVAWKLIIEERELDEV